MCCQSAQNTILRSDTDALVAAVAVMIVIVIVIAIAIAIVAVAVPVVAPVVVDALEPAVGMQIEPLAWLLVARQQRRSLRLFWPQFV